MLEPFKLDLDFAKDIHTLAENSSTISKSLAVIAGVMARKDGINFIDPSKPLQTVTGSGNAIPSNSDPMSKADTIPMQDTITQTYEALNEGATAELWN